MQKLNLPEFEVKVKDQEIFCLVRRKWVALTPEEWVRQHFVNLMITNLHYPKGMMKLEHTMNYFKNVKRSDVTILSKEAGIFMLLECKAPTVKIDQKVINQISEYNKVLNSKYISVSNGLTHFVWEKNQDAYQQVRAFPAYQ